MGLLSTVWTKSFWNYKDDIEKRKKYLVSLHSFFNKLPKLKIIPDREVPIVLLF